MNKIEKEFAKKQKKDSNRFLKWWRKNGYKVLRIILFYIWIPCLCIEKIKDKKYKSLQYSDKTTKKYLDKILPKLIVHCGENPNAILFHTVYDNFYGGIKLMNDLWSTLVYKKSHKAYNYFHKYSDEVKDYILNNYEIDGYKKIRINNWIDWNNVCEKFDWEKPYGYAKDFAKGVIFYK